MLKKTNRLSKSKDIKTAFARGRSFFNPFFTIKFFAQPQNQRFTVVVSTKVFKKAVARNRLKRLLREYLRKNLAGLKKGYYVIIAKPKAADLKGAETLGLFAQVLKKVV